MDSLDARSPVNVTKGPYSGLTRRGFFAAMFGFASGYTAYRLGLNSRFRQITEEDDRLAAAKLEKEIFAGEFNPDSIGKIESLSVLKGRIEEKLAKLEGIKEARVLLSDINTGEEGVKLGAVSPAFPPASLIKVPLIYEVLKMGQRDRKEYLTPGAATRILRYSDNDRLLELIKSLPNHQGKDEEVVIREILEGAGITPYNRLHDLPLRVSLDDLFHHYKSIGTLPSAMANNLALGKRDILRNYGVANVVLRNLLKDNPPPISFKIGLIELPITDPSTSPDYNNSYLLQIGDVNLMGYAQGPNKYSAHKHMLQASALAASYISHRG